MEEVEGIISRHGKILSQTSAKQIITLILSAVRDGRLDEELGVVGRYDLGWPDRYHEVAHNWIDDLPDARLELIALRGTGKEGEG